MHQYATNSLATPELLSLVSVTEVYAKAQKFHHTGLNFDAA